MDDITTSNLLCVGFNSQLPYESIISCLPLAFGQLGPKAAGTKVANQTINGLMFATSSCGDRPSS
jgi:hypothetical protein